MEFNYNMKSPSQSKNHNILLFVINFLQNFNHFEKLTKNLKKIHVNITYKSYSIENPMYKIPLSPAGGLLCTVRLIFEIYSVRDMAPNDRDVPAHAASICM